jgi:polyisoprenoid-binding protein YceI
VVFGMAYVVDKSHTEVGFSVRHMGIATVRGSFTEFSGSLDLDGTTLKGLRAEIDAASVHTRDPQRDTHLRSADFFHAEQHPKITFQSTKVEPLGGNRYRVTGDLAIRGVVKPITLEAETSDIINDPWGKQRVAFNLSGEVDRKEWNLTWNSILEAGRLLVGDKVRLTVEGEAVAE